MREGESLRAICRSEDMPGRTTVLRWLENNEVFRGQYERAREALIEHWGEEILEISDDGTNDYMERQKGEDVERVANGEHIQRSRLRVDTRKWLMSKLAPRKYGDFMRNEHSGPDGGPVVVQSTPTEQKL
jgi:hypothetical protein